MANQCGLMRDPERLRKWEEERNARSRQMLTWICHDAPEVRGGGLTDSFKDLSIWPCQSLFGSNGSSNASEAGFKGMSRV